MNINVLFYVLLHFGNHRIYITTQSNFQVNPARAIKCDCKTISKTNIYCSISPFLVQAFTNHYTEMQTTVLYQALSLVKMVPGSWRDLAKIPARFPPGSRRDFGRLGGIPAGILPGFLAGGGIPGGQNLGGIPAGILPGFLAGGGIPGGQNLGGIPAGILPGFLAGGGIPGGQNLGGIPAGVLPGFLAGNRISRWECCRDSRRETKPLAVKILLRSGRKAKFPSAKISGGPVWNLARIRDENVININQTTRR